MKKCALVIISIVLFVLLIKGCSMIGSDMDKAQEECCMKNSCTWLFEGNCPRRTDED